MYNKIKISREIPAIKEWRVMCSHCGKLQETYRYQAHFMCVVCNKLVGFPDINDVPSKWNTGATELINLEAEEITDGAVS